MKKTGGSVAKLTMAVRTLIIAFINQKQTTCVVFGIFVSSVGMVVNWFSIGPTIISAFSVLTRISSEFSLTDLDLNSSRILAGKLDSY